MRVSQTAAFSLPLDHSMKPILPYTSKNVKWVLCSLYRSSLAMVSYTHLQLPFLFAIPCHGAELSHMVDEV